MRARLKTGITVIIIAVVFSLFYTKKEGIVGSMRDDENEQSNGYKQISQEDAKDMMDSDYELIVLDVRSQAEYATGHIEDAICIPLDEIESAEDQLTDLNQTILVYCRSGSRSKAAASMLAELGYTNVYEFGGILDWSYDIVQ